MKSLRRNSWNMVPMVPTPMRMLSTVMKVRESAADIGKAVEMGCSHRIYAAAGAE